MRRSLAFAFFLCVFCGPFDAYHPYAQPGGPASVRHRGSPPALRVSTALAENRSKLAAARWMAPLCSDKLGWTDNSLKRRLWYN